MFGHQLSHEDIEKYKKLILNQLINCMHTLILDLALLGLEFDSEGKFHFQSKLEYIQAFSDIFQKTIDIRQSIDRNYLGENPSFRN